MKKCSLLLISCFISLNASATINFISIEPISFQKKNEKWVLEFWNLGRYSPGSDFPIREKSYLEIYRNLNCIGPYKSNDMYRTSQEEFGEAIRVLDSQVKGGGVLRFGLNSLKIPKTKNGYWAVNLRVFDANGEVPTVWSIKADVGNNHCPYEGL